MRHIRKVGASVGVAVAAGTLATLSAGAASAHTTGTPVNTTPTTGTNQQAPPRAVGMPTPPRHVALQRTQTVKRGDTLFGMTEHQLGNGNLYPEVAKANGITNPDLIFPGQTFTFTVGSDAPPTATPPAPLPVVVHHHHHHHHHATTGGTGGGTVTRHEAPQVAVQAPPAPVTHHATHHAATVAPAPATGGGDNVSGYVNGHNWDSVAAAESGGQWHLAYGTYDSTGGLQIRQSTWNEFGGQQFAKAPYLASKAQQIQVAERILAAQGPGAWTTVTIGRAHL